MGGMVRCDLHGQRWRARNEEGRP